MKRRDFLRYTALHTIIFSQYLNASIEEKENLFDYIKSFFESEEKIKLEKEIVPKDSIEVIKEDIKKNEENNSLANNPIEESDVKVEKDELITKEKIETHNIYIDEKKYNSALSISNKLRDIQRYIGYGNFNLISFDEMLKVPQYSGVKHFTKEEIEFLEYIFYYDPKFHGFYGERVSHKITDAVNKKDVIKIPHTGHFLFKGEPHKTYLRMCEDIGETLILTSGIRSIVKQSKLFIDKLKKEEGNLSQTSKSLAPPAFTYHSIADFDVGKKGFGYANFTSRFALTEEFFKMRKLEYIDIRYTIKNLDGVRYEPWHVKVI